MNAQPDFESLADNLYDTLADDMPIDEWTLDELDRSADLGSLRSAWTQGAGLHD